MHSLVACMQGEYYLAFGSLFPSPTKPNAVHCPLETLTEARQFDRPVVAIGGISIERALEAIAAGSDLIAVIRVLFDASDIQAQARRWAQAF